METPINQSASNITGRMRSSDLPEDKTMQMISIIPQIFMDVVRSKDEKNSDNSEDNMTYKSIDQSDTDDIIIPLTDLETGEVGKVVRVNSESEFAGRLKDLGFVSGTLIRCRQKAPFRDPVEYEVRGSRFCLRHHEARDIQILLIQRN